jgi:D-2-hydroxyacid dehydrogenase (NADP+)
MPCLLVTPTIAGRYGNSFRLAAGPETSWVVMPAEGGVPPQAELDRVDAAFLSTDLMGGSNKGAPNARLRAFAQAVAAAPALQWLQTCSAGADREILQQSMRRGVRVTTSSGANAQAVAQTAIAGMLALARGVPHWVSAQAACHWSTLNEGLAPRDIDGGHALVIGMGPVGQAIARICQAMGLRTSGVRRHAQPEPGFDAVLTHDTMVAILGSVDWVFLACPLTSVTRDLVDSRFIAALTSGARLVNVSRGEVVQEEALHQALREGRLAGCYSDVFVEEPLPPDSPWWTLPNTLISPHCAAVSTGFPQRTVDAFVQNLGRYVRGEPLVNLASPA